MPIRIFCEVDDFCKQFDKNFNSRLLTDGNGKRIRSFNLTISEIMTICIYYHESGYKTFKDYYEKHVLINMQNDFHNLVSYNRFLERAFFACYICPTKCDERLYWYIVYRQFCAQSLPYP